MKQGWENHKFGKVIKLEYGKPLDRSKRKFNGKYPVYGANGEKTRCDEYYCGEKSIIVGRKGSAGEINITENFFWPLDVTFFVTYDKKQYDFKFLFYQLKKLNLPSLAKGVKPGINRNDVYAINITLPPLSEQKRIVTILDKALTAVAKARTNAEQNLKNAKELFESYLQGVFENKGEDWEEKEFGSVITTLTDYHANGSYKILKNNVELKDLDDYAWMVRSTDFENNFQNNFKYVDKHGYDFLSKSKIFGNEIIMSKIGNAGNVYLMPTIDRPCSLAMNLFLIRMNEKKVIPAYIYRYLKTNSGEAQIKIRLKGATTKTITKDNVRNIIIPIPSLKKQKAIINKMAAISTKIKKIETVYQQKVGDLEELKKSVLQKAFNGEL